MQGEPLQVEPRTSHFRHWLGWSSLLVVVAMVGLEYRQETSLRKTSFSQVDLDGCSSWKAGNKQHGCLIADPGQPTTASLVAQQDYEVLYFALLVRRRFSRPHFGSLYYRIEFKGKLIHQDGRSFDFVSDDEINTEGAGGGWKLSFPRRILWAKHVKKGQNVTIQLDFIKIFSDRKTNEFDDDFAKLGVTDFALVAESDTNWLVRRILACKTAAFYVMIPMVCYIIYLSERGRISVWRSVFLVALGISFLAATYPQPRDPENVTPEEYFSDKTQVMLNYFAYTGLETLMGYQALLEAFPSGTKGRGYLVPLLGIGYLILWYVRHVHISDFKDSANVYSEGDARVWRYWLFKTLLGKSVFISSAPCLVVSLLSPLFGRGFSPVSLFLGYMTISFILERHVLALFSTWKFARDLTMWILGYLYLFTWVPPAPIINSAVPAKNRDEEETVELTR